MSNLTSNFDVLAGLPPHGVSALEDKFQQKTGETPELEEGMIVAVENAAGVAVVSKLTSATLSTAIPDYPWLVIQGMDQSDAEFTDQVTVLAVKSGMIFKVDTVVSFAVGDLAFANAGVLAKIVGGSDKYAIGQVIEYNSTAGYVVIAT
jgi:hypothetical protein